MMLDLRPGLRAALGALLVLVAAPTALPALAPPAPPLFDCNGNGVEDAVDIALGASPDANRNGVPDECEGGGGRAASVQRARPGPGSIATRHRRDP